MKNKLKYFLELSKANLGLKCLSLLIAVVVWLVVVQYVNPDDTRTLNNIPIQVNTTDSVPAGEGLVLVTNYDKELSFTYTASRDVIAMLNVDKITAYVDLSGATKSGEYSFPVKIDTGGQNITIVDQSVKEATLKFEKASTAQVKVNVTAEGSVPDGYVKNDPVCIPANINIEGPESKVSQIVAANVVITENKYTQTNVYSCDYQFVDKDGNEISKDFITADYDKVDVTVTVLKTKTVPITATLVNSSGGYENNFATVEIIPSTITIAGSEEALDTLNSYDLGTIDVSEKLKDFETDYVVSLKNGVKNVDGLNSVKVKVSFGDVRTKTIKFSAFKIENLDQKQSAIIKDKNLSITFRGLAADIEKINSSNVSIAVDFQNKTYTNGINTVPVYAIIPGDLKVGVVGKYQLTVNIT